MAYSRWSNSTWYTYYSTTSGSTTDTQIMDINGEYFNYRELKDRIEICLDKCEPHTREEREELRGYIMEFIADVESGTFMTGDDY